MGVSIKATYSPLVKRPIGQFISQFPKETAAAFEEVYPPIREQALIDLRRIPARRYWQKEDWASEKQRIAFFATNGFGGGIPHRRTGRLPAGWQMDARVQGVTIHAEIKNTEKGAPYVYGSLASSGQGKYQQRGHIRTGWSKAYTIVTFWLDALKDDLYLALRERLGEVVTGIGTRRRASTRTRRR